MQHIIYQKLLKAYGPQGWWPLTSIKTRGTQQGTEVTAANSPAVLSKRACIEETARVCYHQPVIHRLHRFEIAVGAILTQNTAWTNVEKALTALYEKKALAPEKIISLSHKKLTALIRPAGYFNQKAERLKTLALFFQTTDITKEETAALRTKLLALNGVGPETADSIILYAAEKPVFVIDTYTKRIFSRIGFLHENASYDQWQDLFHGTLPRETQLFKEFHALLVEHAKQHCQKKPICKHCPLVSLCKKRI